MRKYLGRGIVLVLLLLMISSSLASAEGGPDLSELSFDEYKDGVEGFDYEYDNAFKILDLLNKLRRSQGLNNLKMDRELLEQAMHRALEIRVYFSHTRPNGKPWNTIGEEKGHKNLAWGENIASGYRSAEAVMDGWINSPGHYKNMINQRWKTVGIGCHDYKWVQLFSPDEGDVVVRDDHPARMAIKDLVFSSLEPVNPNGWNRENGKWYYCQDSKRQIHWKKISGKWYYFGEDSYMQTGWIRPDKNWYYLNKDGKMETGWIQLKGKWYYLNKSGRMQTGWIKDKGKWYYLNANGAMS